MRLGIVSDIHGNAAALSRALALMDPLDGLLCLGDSISQYRFSNEAVALLRARNAQVILGNHEEVFFGRQGERARAAPWIDPELMAWLESQPRSRMLDLCDVKILMTHSTPWPSDHAYVCAHHQEFTRFGQTEADVVLYGHTHQPVSERVGRSLVLNPGSTGEATWVGERFQYGCAVLNLPTLDVRLVSMPA